MRVFSTLLSAGVIIIPVLPTYAELLQVLSTSGLDKEPLNLNFQQI